MQVIFEGGDPPFAYLTVVLRQDNIQKGGRRLHNDPKEKK
jgi:hypothetical protein